VLGSTCVSGARLSLRQPCECRDAFFHNDGTCSLLGVLACLCLVSYRALAPVSRHFHFCHALRAWGPIYEVTTIAARQLGG
jgi:hypothetical protein